METSKHAKTDQTGKDKLIPIDSVNKLSQQDPNDQKAATVADKEQAGLESKTLCKEREKCVHSRESGPKNPSRDHHGEVTIFKGGREKALEPFMADLAFRFCDHERHHESEQAESYEQEKIRAVSPFEKEHFSYVRTNRHGQRSGHAEESYPLRAVVRGDQIHDSGGTSVEAGCKGDSLDKAHDDHERRISVEEKEAPVGEAHKEDPSDYKNLAPVTVD